MLTVVGRTSGGERRFDRFISHEASAFAKEGLGAVAGVDCAVEAGVGFGDGGVEVEERGVG